MHGQQNLKRKSPEVSVGIVCRVTEIMFFMLYLNFGSVQVHYVTKIAAFSKDSLLQISGGKYMKSNYEKIKGYRHMEFGEFLLPFTSSTSCHPASGSVKIEVHGTVFYPL